MIKQKLLRAHQAPEEVFERGAAVFGFGGGEEGGGFFEFASGGGAGEGEEVGFFDDLGVGLLAGEQGVEAVVFLGELLVQGLSIRDVEGLGHAGFVRALAFAGGDAVGAAETFEEVAGDVAVGQLQGAEAHGVGVGSAAVGVATVDFEGGGRGGDLADGIEQHLGFQSAWDVVGAVAEVGDVFGKGDAAALVGLALQNGAHEGFQVELLLHEVLARGGEERFVAGGIGDAEVIDGLDEATAEKVCPHAVHDGALEELIIGAGEPVRERDASILAGGHRDGLQGIERTRRLRFAGERRDEIALRVAEKHAFIGLRAVFRAHTGEEIREGVVLIVGPLFHRVVVTLRAADGGAEEGDADGFGALRRLVIEDEKVAAAVLERAAGGGEQITHHGVPRRVRGDVTADPVVIRPHGLRHEFVAIHEEEIAPSMRPVIDELGPLQQRVNEVVAFVRGLVGEEGLRFFHRGQNADCIEKRPAQELRVRGATGGRDVQLAQFRQNMLVDEVARFQGREGFHVRLARIRHGDGGDAQQAQIPGADRCLTAARGLDEAAVIHGGHAGVGGVVFAPAGDVLAVPVAEFRGDFELHALASLRDEMRLRHAERRDARIIRLRPRCPRRDPIDDGFVFRRIHLETLVALVRHRFDRFEEKEAASWIFECQAAAIRTPRDRKPVALVIETTQREAEAALSRRRAMAGTHRAAVAGEDRLDGIAEGRGFGGCRGGG